MTNRAKSRKRFWKQKRLLPSSGVFGADEEEVAGWGGFFRVIQPTLMWCLACAGLIVCYWPVFDASDPDPGHGGSRRLTETSLLPPPGRPHGAPGLERKHSPSLWVCPGILFPCVRVREASRSEAVCRSFSPFSICQTPPACLDLGNILISAICIHNLPHVIITDGWVLSYSRLNHSSPQPSGATLLLLVHWNRGSSKFLLSCISLKICLKGLFKWAV